MTCVAVIATLDSKTAAAAFTCATLRELGVTPWLMDLSLKPHSRPGADIGGELLAKLSGTDWSDIGTMDRATAADTMIKGGARALVEKFEAGEISAVIGVGGANGCTVFCGMMRALPPLFPKLMVTPVAATAAVQWYVAESDIAMFPTISDIVMNRFVKSVIENACSAAKGMADAYERRPQDISPELLQRIERGASYSGEEYAAALSALTDADAFFAEFFHDFDAIVAPSAAGKAPEGLAWTGDPIFCTIWTFCGLPSLSLPLLVGENGLPIGVQLVSGLEDDARLCRTARWLLDYLQDS